MGKSHINEKVSYVVRLSILVRKSDPNYPSNAQNLKGLRKRRKILWYFYVRLIVQFNRLPAVQNEMDLQLSVILPLQLRPIRGQPSQCIVVHLLLEQS